MKEREFRCIQGRTGERYWTAERRGNSVITTWGLICGGLRNEHNRTCDVPGPKGKIGTKSYVTSDDNAQEHMDRLIKKKLESGYVETTGGMITKSASSIDHSADLPKNLCFSKPKNGVSDRYIMDQEDKDNLIFTRKVNGMMVIAHIMADGKCKLYSRRMEPLTDHFPHLVKALSNRIAPPTTILLFEAFMGKGNSKKDMILLAHAMRAKAPKAVEYQKEYGWAKFYLFRVPVWAGKDMETNTPNETWLHWIRDEFSEGFKGDLPFLYSLEILDSASVVEAKDLADRMGYEGWVCYTKDGILGDKSYSFHGKPDRSSCCFKLKNVEEDDFIARFNPDLGTKELPQGSMGTGKNMGRIGHLSLYQLNSKGEEVYIGEVGSGLTDEQRDKLNDPKLWPRVVQVAFEERFYKSAGDSTNAIHLPRFVDFRADKHLGECTNEELD